VAFLTGNVTECDNVYEQNRVLLKITCFRREKLFQKIVLLDVLSFVLKTWLPVAFKSV